MVGFIVGAALVVGLLGVGRALRRRRRWYGGRGGRHALLVRLHTTPAQEAVLAQARTQLQAVLGPLRTELMDTREAAAGSLRADHFDADALRAHFARHAALLEELQRTALGALARVHEALSPAQRAQLAAVLSGGPGRCGPRLAR